MAGKKDLIRLRKRKRRKQNIIRATIHFFVWAGVAVLYYIGFSVFFDTPVEYELKHSTDRLRREYTALVQRYDTLTTVMRNLSERDRNVFRILFESDPYDFDSEYERKQAATYENIFNRSSRRLKRELRERVAEMETRLDELNDTYLDLQARIDSAGSRCDNIPSIQPVINKQLTLLTASYGMRIHPFYKTLQSHQGVDYTIPEGSRVFATADGTVREVAQRNSTSGQTVVIDHGNGYRLRTTTSRRSTSARASRCAAATSSPFRATRAFRWRPTSITKSATTACAWTRSTTFSWSFRPPNTSV